MLIFLFYPAFSLKFICTQYELNKLVIFNQLIVSCVFVLQTRNNISKIEFSIIVTGFFRFTSRYCFFLIFLRFYTCICKDDLV